MRKILSLVAALATLLPMVVAADEHDPRLEPYTATLEHEGHEPVAFVLEQLQTYDLLVFDDAWHPAVEPFAFYQELIRRPEFHKHVKLVFVEVLPINKQPHIDAYLGAEAEDASLLFPAFQDDLGGRGWPLKTYFDLLHTVREVNEALPADDRIRVVAVNAPTFWGDIHTASDVNQFRRSLTGNEYTMYRVITEELDGLSSGRKGIFLTNTRHAYKGIKDKNGEYFWNVGTFLHQWHPGKTYSIRFHNMSLFIGREKTLDAGARRTTGGMERIEYKWVRLGSGLWDSAFAAMGNRPVAFPLEGNVFGAEGYVGNHMHKALPGQTMSDANDAIIFLAPIEALHETELVDFIYTPEFRRELERRYRFLYNEEQLARMMEREGAGSLSDYIASQCTPRAARLISQAESLEPIDAWKTE